MTSYLKYPRQTSIDLSKPCSNAAYAAARFNEIAGRELLTESGIAPDADLMDCAVKPSIGGCAVWKNLDGSVFLAIVERQYIENGRTWIITSERHGKSSAYGLRHRRQGRGNWGMGSEWMYTGCIANPACTLDPDDIPQDPVRFGQRGDAVIVLQFLLNLQGYDAPVNGWFGPHTRNALGIFQRDKGLTIDHICAGGTLRELLRGVYIL
jgi:hypothetical protein